MNGTWSHSVEQCVTDTSEDKGCGRVRPLLLWLNRKDKKSSELVYDPKRSIYNVLWAHKEDTMEESLKMKLSETSDSIAYSGPPVCASSS